MRSKGMPFPVAVIAAAVLLGTTVGAMTSEPTEPEGYYPGRVDDSTATLRYYEHAGFQVAKVEGYYLPAVLAIVATHVANGWSQTDYRVSRDRQPRYVYTLIQ
jgi:hypothetical protein